MYRILILALVACGQHPGTDPGTDPDASSQTDGSSSPIDAPEPATHPRLVVASAAGVQIWDHADELATATAADATLAGIDATALGLAVHVDDLFVTSTHPTSAVYRFATTLEDGATPTGSVSAASFGGALVASHTKLQVDANDDLWIEHAGTLHLVTSASTATGASAHFTHPWGQIAGMAYDETGDHLFGGQISGAGLLVWNQAATRTGEVAAMDYALSSTSAFHAEIAADRLYVSHYSPPDIAVWDDISAVTGSRPPDHTLATLCGSSSAELRYIAVTADDVLVVIHSEDQVETVCMFKDASTMTAGRAPDAVASDPSLDPSASNIDKAVLTSDGRLFVLDRSGIAIFDNALVAPVFVTKLPIESPMDMLVLTR
jgi:hypothetical protein